MLVASCSRTGHLDLTGPDDEASGGAAGHGAADAGSSASMSGAPPSTGASVATTTTTDAATTTGDQRASSAESGLIACNPTSDQDFDGDGYTGADGDCDDCDARVNPSAIETMSNGPGKELVDEDCNGVVNDVALPCDADIDLDTSYPIEAARAIELCKIAIGQRDWGLLAADFVRADGKPDEASNQYGVMPHFGAVRPRDGESVFVMSTGNARTPGQPQACGGPGCTHRQGTTPSGYPTPVPGCPRSSVIGDDVGLEVHLRAPSNARGYRFAFKYHSFEFPEWVCTPYNDEFFVKATPRPEGALSNGNIAFDAFATPVSVDMQFVDVCYESLLSYFARQCVDACPAPPNPYCPLGVADLTGTGFGAWGNAGATRWMQTEAPVMPGEEVALRFAIFDVGDGRLDSTIVLDAFQWITDHEVGKVRTEPAP